MKKALLPILTCVILASGCGAVVSEPAGAVVTSAPDLNDNKTASPEPAYYTGDINIDYLMRRLRHIVKYVNTDVSNEPSRLDAYNQEIDASFANDYLAGQFTGCYTFIQEGMRIIIDGCNITIKTVIVSPGGERKSADYGLVTYKPRSDIIYSLVSADIYDDTRNQSAVILTIDGVDLYEPWYTVNNNGVVRYSLEDPLPGDWAAGWRGGGAH
ncbi:MAG: hypothetical protein LBK41_08480 [Clostridiales bacterium]|jgi:hypothetical protein|nr:hypothetical protein [Clostridiales bacterium]